MHHTLRYLSTHVHRGVEKKAKNMKEERKLIIIVLRHPAQFLLSSMGSSPRILEQTFTMRM